MQWSGVGGRFVSVPGRPPLLSLEEAHLLPGLISAPLKLPAIPLEVTHQPQNSPQDLVSSFMAPTLFALCPSPSTFQEMDHSVGKKKNKTAVISLQPGRLSPVMDNAHYNLLNPTEVISLYGHTPVIFPLHINSFWHVIVV